VPSREQAVNVLTKAQADAQLCARLAVLAVAAGEALLAQMAHSFFVPFCTTAVAACSTIRVRACTTLMQCVSFYNMFLPVSSAFPLHMRAASPIGGRLSECLSLSWNHGIPQLHLHAFEGAGAYQQLVEEHTAQYNIKQHTRALSPASIGTFFIVAEQCTLATLHWNRCFST
jgi:hypothetical protein